jgi:hypothetical protein
LCFAGEAVSALGVKINLLSISLESDVLMSSKILARVTNPDQDRPRGPDVELAISVPEGWLREGATLEIELPRNLACAACRGGGCDACERSGAVSVRGRKDPIELVEVTLPRPRADAGAPPETRPFAMRIPDRGGLGPAGSDLPRGNLLLAVTCGADATRGVTRLTEPQVLTVAARLKSIRPPKLFGGQGRIVVIALIVCAILAFLLSFLGGKH